MKALSICSITRIDRKTLNSVSSFKAHDKGKKVIEYSKKNEFLMASSDDSEIAIWDTRNLSKRLFTVKASGIDGMDFFENDSLSFLVSSGNELKVLDLKNKEEDFEKVGLVVLLWWTCF